jgi:hypothetical protein
LDCSHSAIVHAAVVMRSALSTREIETIPFAVAEFEATVRGLITPMKLTARH